jgi:2-phospho-L-lactate guanylyltransferase
LTKRSRQLGLVHAVVPVNVLRKSKARLSSILNPAERELLTIAMLEDVLSALRKARRVHSITVVSADKAARGIAKRFGAGFLWEGKRRGLNKGVKLAIRSSERVGAMAVLIVHADLPFLKTVEVDKFLDRTRGYSVALTPSKDGDGTNALMLNPPQAISPVFGKNSFRRHLRLAKQRNAPSTVVRFRGIGFDVDKPRDITVLIRRPPRNATGRLLRRFRDPSLQTGR